jgi:uncharacterized protein
MVKLYDVAPDGTAVMFDDLVSTVASGTTTFDLKSTDWTLAAGHALAVEIGTIRSGAYSNWIDTPSHQRIDIQDGRLDLALQDPASDTATDGDPAPYAELYRSVSTVTLPIGPATFALPGADG